MINKLKTLSILLCIASSHVFGQHSGAKVSISDFNKDGIIDTLKTYTETGSGYGRKLVEIINGKTGEMYFLDSSSYFNQIRETILIPSILNKSENALFLNILKSELLPPKRDEPDGSLSWIIAGLHSNTKPENNKYFDLLINPRTEWINTGYEPPTSYYTVIKNDTVNKLYNTNKEISIPLDNNDNTAFLVYYGHNHYRNRSGDSIKLSDSNSIYKIYNTSHGVIVKKDNQHKWLFVSDFELTGAPDKLRWESIEKVKLVDKHIIIQQKLPTTDIIQLFVINIETGVCGKLKFDFSNTSDTNIDLFLIDGDSIILNFEEKQVSHKLKDVFKNLKNSEFTQQK